MPRPRSLHSAAATLSLVGLLAAGGTAAASGSGPGAASAEALSPDPQAVHRRIESYRVVLALLQRQEAEIDLDLFVRGVADLAPELAPFASALRRQILGLASGDLDLVVESLEEIGRAYRDRLPPIYFQGLEREAVVRQHASAERADRQDLLDLAGELMAAVPDQPEPLQEPIRRLLEQVEPGASKADAEGGWASEADLGGPLKLFHRVAGESVPPDLRAGLDDALAALAGDLVSIKARAGEAAASFVLAELARCRTYLDRLGLELPEEPDPYPLPARPTPADPTPERRR